VTHSDTDAGIPEMTVDELKRRMDEEQPLLLVDVREAFESDIADLPEYGQRRIPLGEFPVRLHELDKDRPLVVYCRTGNRSAWAVQFLQHHGFENVWNLSGGVMAWREEVDPSLQQY
jgi:adenylyltransferase/sulfurtransferase